MKAKISKIRNELNEFSKTELVDLAIKFLNDRQVSLLAEILYGGFDFNLLIDSDITLQQLMESKGGYNE
tara:strand:- start:2908 stop:3114 length:207 start_codon:yes stop_codon:yes gene_type:complete